MRVYNEFDFSKPNSPPTFKAQTEEFHCFHCGRPNRILVPQDCIDWKKVADQYEAYIRQMWSDCNLLLSETGCDTLLEHKLKEILKRCKEALLS